MRKNNTMVHLLTITWLWRPWRSFQDHVCRAALSRASYVKKHCFLPIARPNTCKTHMHTHVECEHDLAWAHSQKIITTANSQFE